MPEQNKRVNMVSEVKYDETSKQKYDVKWPKVRGKSESSRGTSSSNDKGRGRGRDRDTRYDHSQCGQCGGTHAKGRCPARGQTCRSCKKKNHFAKVCRTVREVREDTSDDDEFCIDSVISDKSKPWVVTLNICDTSIPFKIDTGADISIISSQTYRSLKKKPQLKKATVKLTSPGGKLETEGEFWAKTVRDGKKYKFRVVVVQKRLTSNLLSRNVTDKLGLVMRCENVDFWPVKEERLEILKAETVHASAIRQVIGYVLNGWPQVVPENLRAYQQVQGELSVMDGLLVYNSRIVVPVSQRKIILHKLHASHQGLNKCRERAQLSVWWPGLSTQLKELINTCETCREARPSQRNEPLLATPLPDRPWQKLGADLFTLKGKDYIVVVDYYSRWIEFTELHNTSAVPVVKFFKRIMSTHGIPETIRTDNGPQFDNQVFRKFAEEYEFTHTTSSPHFAQSNGEAESSVKIAKKLLRQDDVETALLNYRTTPHSSTGVSPCMALMGRQLRTSIPVLPQNLKPQPPQDHLIRSADQNTKKSYSDGYNKRHGTTPLSQLKPGDPVLMKSDAEKTWSRSGTVVASDDRTYLVNTPMGVVRRNRKHLQLLPSPQSTAGESPQPRAEGSPESTAGGCSQSMAQVGGDSQSTVGEDSHASSSTTNGEMTLPTQIPEE